MSLAALAHWSEKRGPTVFRIMTALVMVLAFVPVLFAGAWGGFFETYPSLWRALKEGKRH